MTLEEGLMLSNALCRQNLRDFTRKTFGIVSPSDEYLHNWHIDCICEYLQAVHAGDIRRLIINMPPRSLKSIITSIAFPAWLLGKNPSEQVIVASYAELLANKLSVDTRLVVQSPWYKQLFPRTVITKDQNEKSKFQTTLRGHRIATTVGSAIMGEGGNFLIVDDPIDPMQALSETKRETANTWFDQKLVSRQNSKKTARIVVVMQRVHTDDLTGHLRERGGWESLVLPAKAFKKTIIDLRTASASYYKEMKEGELLHEGREGEKELAATLRELGDYAFAGQYLQEPVPLGGGEFKSDWVQYYQEVLTGQGMNIYILVDAANEKKKSSDYTAMMVVGFASDNNIYLLDVVRDKLNPTERINAIINLHKKWNARSGKPPKVGYEKYGLMSDTHYLKKAQSALNYRFPVVELGGKLSKGDRIRRLIPDLQQQRIYLPNNLLYTDTSGTQVDLVHQLVHEEMLTFPVSRHDDMLDAFSRIYDKELSALFPRIQPSPMLNTERLPTYTRGTNSDSWETW